MLAEIDEREPLPRKGAGRGRDDHLAAVRRRSDPRRTMHLDPHIARLVQPDLAGMHAHPHAQPAKG